jgi:hypothetical protein
MPYYKNQFQEPTYYEHTILDEKGKTIGTVRIKPSSILWKPVNAREFYSIPLQKFAELMQAASTKASKTKS